ncbi:sulfotransferase domain-containing protein [Lentisalinibacter salinarum]|uniref:sulfotransferase domain-containing protein n=1 Tax=Lentisalinibacter salinarum TaxID=2992239 RepID=UPI0038673E24
MPLLPNDELLWFLFSVRRRFRRQGPSIVLTSMPKSGSTFLSRVLQSVTGFSDAYLACAYGNTEQELYLPKVMDAWGRGTVTQQHFKANRHNLNLLEAFALRPVVLVRNVLDVLVSMRDHALQPELNSLPGLYPPSGFSGLGEERQFDFLVDYAAPWLISFYVSWEQVLRNGRSEVLLVRYEDAKQDWAVMGARILEFCGVEIEAERISRTVDRLQNERPENVRRNVGIVGRGSQMLTESQRERVATIASLYPDVDFSLVGL